MKNKIITICLILIVILCIGITQLPGIYAVPTDYSDFEGIVITENDKLLNQLPEGFLYTFRSKEDTLEYTDEYTNFVSYEYLNTYIASFLGYRKNYNINSQNNPYPDIPIPSEINEESFWNYIFTISKHWKVYTTSLTYYGTPTLFFKPYDYIEPEYKIECNPTEITPGETSKCELKVKYHSKIRSLNFKLDTDQYNISNVEAGDDFEDLQENDGVYSLASKSSLEDSEEGRTTTILSFLIKSDGNTVSSADNIKVVDLEYHDELSESPKKMISATVTQNKQEKADIKNIINNPKTRNNIMIIILLLTIITTSIIISNRSKEIDNKK